MNAAQRICFATFFALAVWCPKDASAIGSMPVTGKGCKAFWEKAIVVVGRVQKVESIERFHVFAVESIATISGDFDCGKVETFTYAEFDSAQDYIESPVVGDTVLLVLRKRSPKDEFSGTTGSIKWPDTDYALPDVYIGFSPSKGPIVNLTDSTAKGDEAIQFSRAIRKLRSER